MSLQYHGLMRKRSSIDRSYMPGTTVLHIYLHISYCLELDVWADAEPRVSGHDQGLLERVPRLADGVARWAARVRAAADPRRAGRVRAQNALALVPLVRAASRLASADQAHHDVPRRSHTAREHRQAQQVSEEGPPVGGLPQVPARHQRRRPLAALQ